MPTYTLGKNTVDAVLGSWLYSSKVQATMVSVFAQKQLIAQLQNIQTAVSLCRVVDFGPGTDVEYAFKSQKKMNPEGMSPPLCSEY